MRLSELDPTWLWLGDRQGVGVLFECPACRDEDRGHGLGHYIAVYFSNPLDGGEMAGPKHQPKPRWLRAGTTFEDLSLMPSIHAECWHGFVRLGEILTC